MRDDGPMKIQRNAKVTIAAAIAFAAVAAGMFLLDLNFGDSESWWESIMYAVAATIAMAIIAILTVVSSDWFSDWMDSKSDSSGTGES